MCKISVVVPIYNVEKYLLKCLESISQQTYKNIEIILVNDGSTDSSRLICEEFIKKDSRAILINKENGGLSDARNFGEEHSTGEYVIFIDSDDYIETDMIEILYNNIKNSDSDISVCSVNNIYIDKSTPQCLDTNLYFTTDKIGFLKEYFIGEKIPGTICNKLIKKEITSRLKFPVGKIYEDAFYHYDLFKLANKYVVTTKPLYNYFHRQNSITTKKFSSKNVHCIEAYTKFYKYILKYIPELKGEAFFRLSYAYFTVFDKILLEDNYKSIEEYKYIKKFLKKNFMSIFKNKNFRFTRRIAAMALKLNVKLYRILLLEDLKKNKGIN